MRVLRSRSLGVLSLGKNLSYWLGFWLLQTDHPARLSVRRHLGRRIRGASTNHNIMFLATSFFIFWGPPLAFSISTKP